MRGLCGGETHDSDCMSKEERERRRGQEQEANNSNNVGWGERRSQSPYSMVQKNSCIFEFLAFLPPTNLGLRMERPSALMKHVSLNLARFFCSTLYYGEILFQ